MSEQSFQCVHAQAENWRDATEHCLAQIEPGCPATLGFLYVTSACAEHLDDIVICLRKHTGVMHWVGASSLTIHANTQTHAQGSAISILLTCLSQDDFRVVADMRDPGIADLRSHDESRLTIAHADPETPHLWDSLQQLALPPELGFLVGGVCVSESSMQYADRSVSGGFSGVVLSERVPVRVGISHSVVPIGERHSVTECDGNLLIGIDDRPALEVFLEIAGEVVARSKGGISGDVYVGFPIPGAEGRDYQVRPLIGVDTRHQVVAVGSDVQRGDAIWFCHQDSQAASEDLRRMASKLRRQLERKPRGALYFSCTGRGARLFESQDTELQHLAEALGDVPLSGCQVGGELYRDRLYAHTGVLLLFL